MMLHNIESELGTMAKIYRISVILFILFTLSGCGRNELHFKIRFNHIMGLKAGDKLLFESNSVGSVEKVLYTRDGDYLVDIAVKSNFSNAATRHSQFFIVEDPSAEGSKAIEIIQEKTGGDQLRDGEIVTGSEKPDVFQALLGSLQKETHRFQEQTDDYFEKLKESLHQSIRKLEGELEDTLDGLAEQFSRFSGEGQKAPDSNELKTLEESLAGLAEEVARSQEVIREKIKKEVVPKIQEHLDRLRENLQQYNRQEEMTPLDRQLEELRKV
jgi:hypothetical protein